MLREKFSFGLGVWEGRWGQGWLDIGKVFVGLCGEYRVCA